MAKTKKGKKEQVKIKSETKAKKEKEKEIKIDKDHEIIDTNKEDKSKENPIKKKEIKEEKIKHKIKNKKIIDPIDEKINKIDEKEFDKDRINIYIEHPKPFSYKRMAFSGKALIKLIFSTKDIESKKAELKREIEILKIKGIKLNNIYVGNEEISKKYRLK